MASGNTQCALELTPVESQRDGVGLSLSHLRVEMTIRLRFKISLLFLHNFFSTVLHVLTSTVLSGIHLRQVA